MASWLHESVRRFRDILALVSHHQVRTAYEVARHLKLPVSSAYLIISEMERLACLARDENGYLLVGMRPLQMALSMMGFAVSAHHLTPLVRHLRDRCSETSFVASLDETLTIGTVAMGYRLGCLGTRPAQAYRVLSPVPTLDERVFELQLFDSELYQEEAPVVHMIGMVLQRAQNTSSRVLLVGVARANEPPGDRDLITRRLTEVRTLFGAGQDVLQEPPAQVMALR